MLKEIKDCQCLMLASLTSELVDSSPLCYLRRIRYASRATGANLSCSKKQKKTATNVTVGCLLGSFAVKKRDLNYTPLWRKRSRALGATHLCSPYGEPPREQLCSPRWRTSSPTRLRCVICALGRKATPTLEL